jgi:hypothetical protein
MISEKDAYYLMNKNISEEEIVNMTDCGDSYVFGTRRKDGASRGGIGGYPKIDKKTGEVGTMWLMDWFKSVEAGKNREIDISNFKLEGDR